ncbi:unnamed protein product [Rhodiola kirilowii]
MDVKCQDSRLLQHYNCAEQEDHLTMGLKST